MDLLDVQGTRFVPEFAHDLHDISRIEPIHRETEFLGRFVRGAGDRAVSRCDIDEDMPAFDVLHMRKNGAFYQIGLIRNQSALVIPDYMIVRALIGQEDHPSLDPLGGDHLRRFDNIALGIPAETVHHRTGCRRDHRHLVVTVLPRIECRWIRVVHLPDGLRIEDALGAPSLPRTIG